MTDLTHIYTNAYGRFTRQMLIDAIIETDQHIQAGGTYDWNFCTTCPGGILAASRGQGFDWSGNSPDSALSNEFCRICDKPNPNSGWETNWPLARRLVVAHYNLDI